MSLSLFLFKLNIPCILCNHESSEFVVAGTTCWLQSCTNYKIQISSIIVSFCFFFFIKVIKGECQFAFWGRHFKNFSIFFFLKFEEEKLRKNWIIIQITYSWGFYVFIKTLVTIINNTHPPITEDLSMFQNLS